MHHVMIVLNYNDAHKTAQFIENSNRLPCVDMLLVVDNASPDGSFEALKAMESEKIEAIQTHENGGYAHGNNYGVRYAISKWNPDVISIANPDIMIENEAAEAVLRFVDSHPQAGMVSCALQGHPEGSGWKGMTYGRCLAEDLFFFHWLFRALKRWARARPKRDAYEVGVVPGCFFAIRTKTLQSVGLMDEGTFLYYEENILAFKLGRAGYRNFILGGHAYRHEDSASISKAFHAGERFAIRHQSRMYYCKKYLGAGAVRLALLQLAYRVGSAEYGIYRRCRSLIEV